jgi:hypothetical protein
MKGRGALVGGSVALLLAGCGGATTQSGSTRSSTPASVSVSPAKVQQPAKPKHESPAEQGEAVGKKVVAQSKQERFPSMALLKERLKAALEGLSPAAREAAARVVRSYVPAIERAEREGKYGENG